MNNEFNPLVAWVHERVHKRNKSCNILVIGGTGSGKSYGGLRLAELLSLNKFSADNVQFKAIKVMEKINSKKLKRGDVLLWDELGVEHDAKRFMTISNRVLNYFFQTSRHLGLTFIMTVPFASMVDASTRKLANIVIETQKIDFIKNRCLVKVLIKQTNPLSGKEYHKLLRWTDKNDKKKKMSKMWLNLPSKHLIDKYEVMKTEFTTELNKKIQAMLMKDEAKDSTRPKALTDIQLKIAQALQTKSVKEVSLENGICLPTIYAHINTLRRKGYDVRPIREENRVIRYDISGL